MLQDRLFPALFLVVLYAVLFGIGRGVMLLFKGGKGEQKAREWVNGVSFALALIFITGVVGFVFPGVLPLDR